MVNRLGNLTLLGLSFNRQIGNSIYREKITNYQQSVYQVTKDIQTFAAEAWTPDTIATRQTALAKTAIQVWQCNFS